MKICPLLSANVRRKRECVGAECAWFSEATKECAFKTIAEDGGYVYSATEKDWDGILDDETDMADRVPYDYGGPHMTKEEHDAAVEALKKKSGLRFGMERS